MIKKIKHLIETQTTLLQKKAGILKEEDVECFIDEEVVECKEMNTPPYTGVPAPVVTEPDAWFNSTYTKLAYSEKQLAYIQEQTHKEEMKKCMSTNSKSDTKEVENIHQVMYDMSTSSGKTTIQLNPIGGSENFQGGSENYHERNCK